MKIEQSQLEYLFTRSKNYDRKYQMFYDIIRNIPCEAIHTCIELFGGVGISSKYIEEYFNLTEHTIIDLDSKCCQILKRQYPTREILNIDNTIYNNKKDTDLLVIDSVFNKSVFEKVVSLIKKFNFKYLILTNTGVFNVRWNKSLSSYDEYWELLDKELNTYSLYTHKVIYGSEFGFMLITKEPAEKIVLDRYPAEKKLTDWRAYVEDIKCYLENENKEGDN